MSQKRNNKRYILIGAVVGFFLGICGNLIAAWIQQDVISNSFSPLRIGIIVLCSFVGAFVIATLESKMPENKEKSVNEKNKNSYSRIRLTWSKLRTKGKDIKMDDVSAFGSDIDIDSK